MASIEARILAFLAAATLLAGAAAQTPIQEGYVPVGDGVELYYLKLGEGPPT
jgi:hypothetical protein